MTTTDIQKEIVEEFSLFENKNDKYNYIIEMGKGLDALSEDHKVDKNLIKGCQSRVWLHPELEEGKIRYEVDSDALIVRGIVGLLVRILSNQKPEDIVNTELFFIKDIGLDQMLSMNRSNGLAAMVKQMKLYALAYRAKMEEAN